MDNMKLRLPTTKFLSRRYNNTRIIDVDRSGSRSMHSTQCVHTTHKTIISSENERQLDEKRCSTLLQFQP